MPACSSSSNVLRSSFVCFPQSSLPLDLACSRSAPGSSPRLAVRLLLAIAGILMLVLALSGAAAVAQTAHLSYAQIYLNLPSALNNPEQIAIDKSGNIYVADQYNRRVLKLAPSGGTFVQSTIGSGFGYPYGVAVDGAGNVYIADITLSTLVKETPSGNGYTQSTIGSGLYDAVSVAVDTSGNVYVVEINNSFVGTMLKETPAGNTYTQSAIPVPGSHGVGAVAVDSHGDLFVCDSWDEGELYELQPSQVDPGSYTTIPILTGPVLGVTVDANDNVFAANVPYGDITELVPSGGSYTSSVLTTNGSGAYYGYFGPRGIAVDANGDIFFSDIYVTDTLIELARASGSFGPIPVGQTSYSISMFFTFDGETTLGSTSVSTQGIAGLDYTDAGTGNCYAGWSYGTNEQCYIDVQFAPTAAGSRYGAATLFDGSGNPLATGFVEGIGVAAQTAFLPGTQSALVTGAPGVTGVAIDAGNNLYYSVNGGRTVYEDALSSSGALSVVANASNGLVLPGYLALDGNGSLYIADDSGGAVYQMTPTASGWAQSTVASGLGELKGVAVDAAGDVYVASLTNQAVYEETPTPSGYSQTTVASGSMNPYGVAVDLGGNVYICDQLNNQVLKETPAGGSYAQSVAVSQASGLSDPAGIAVDAVGNLYIDDSGNNRVLKETPSGAGYAQSVINLDGTQSATGVAVDGKGNLYVTDSLSGKLVEIDVSDPPSLNFAFTGDGQTSSDSPQTVTLLNNGNATLDFPAPSTGANPSVAANFTLSSGSGSDCPSETSGSFGQGTLAAGFSCLLPISFTPQAGAQGGITGFLVLTDNSLNAASPNFATQSISLSGSAGVVPALISPVPSSTMASGSVLFQWSPGVGAASFQLKLGTTGAGSSDLYNGAPTTATSASVNIPANGATVYAQLSYLIGSTWSSIDYTYTEPAGAPALVAPAPSSTLSSGSVLFQWSPGTGPTKFELKLGTTGVGSSDLYNGAATTATSVTVSIPANGVTVFARLFYFLNAAWHSIDYTYTEAGTPAPPALTTPAPSSVLASGSVLFQWTPGTGSAEFELKLGTTGVGSSDLYSGVATTGTSASATIPANGVTVFARLEYLLNGVWHSIDYTYTEAGTPAPPALTTPATPSVLASGSVLFQWTPGTGSTKFELKLGTTGVGSTNLYNGPATTATSVTVSIPADGVTVFARLEYFLNAAWHSIDYTYTESGTPAPPALTTPAPSSVLASGSVLFQWTPGTGSAEFELKLGTTGVGSSNLYNGAAITGTSASATIPASGVTVFARLEYRLNGVWHSLDYTYTEPGTPAPPALTTPAPSSVLSSGSVLFQWGPGTGAAEFELKLGTTGVGSSNLYNGAATTGRSASATIPADGVTVFARLDYLLNGVWHSIDYTYTEAGTPAPPALTTPAPSSVLASGSVLFQWTAGTGPAEFELKLGTNGVGSSNLYNGAATTATSATAIIPSNGAKVYARLWYLLNGTWHSIDYVYFEP